MLSAERAFPYVGGADTEVVRRDPALACRCADVAPAFFDVLYPLRGRPVGVSLATSVSTRYGTETKDGTNSG
jgi:hypothetical protein